MWLSVAVKKWHVSKRNDEWIQSVNADIEKRQRNITFYQ